MAAGNDKTKNKNELWEILTIILIWLIVISIVYVIFWKVRIAINL
ncbi:hypothetical protein [Dyadobacter arcticus]|uniref:Heme/copper-type cytochrome/quinol oxidase subunit 2 n=1 Tax=Dyadobacter arcticus TaxID=1078754 RepID=A0ABX0UQE0_9BACT|nr:hypothetical protein [Dyadobacter arcticus]NIJ55177.1 heme/copper-type cytochrome/quinol oxidase subunit 2 [Dyadobacter arcticus]